MAPGRAVRRPCGPRRRRDDDSLGTEGILQTYGLEGTVLGATVVTAVLTLQDLFLTVEALRKGVPEIGVAQDLSPDAMIAEPRRRL